MLNHDQTQRFRWEFLRRNERFRKDYQGLERTLGRAPEAFDRSFHAVWLALYSKSEAQVTQDFPNVDLQWVKDGFVELGRFKEKWGIASLQSPQSPEVPEFLREQAHNRRVVEVLVPQSAPGEEPSATLDLRIDVMAPRSEIMRHVEDLLTLHRKMYAQQTAGDLPSPKNAELEQSLRLYDEVYGRGRSVEQVVEQMFPGVKDEQLRGNLEHARRLLEQAKHFVEVGFPSA